MVATTDEEINRLSTHFFVIKLQRMALSKLPDIFSGSCDRRICARSLSAKLADGSRAIQVHALECDTEVISIFACVADGERFSTMFNTYTRSRKTRVTAPD